MTSSDSPRRTFAIIAHPDAGKTTLTEKLLLYGGAIRLAGMVRARGSLRRTRSDWMKIEQERGISVASSVMTLEYDEHRLNLLDTPGHEDFSEDTCRTLTAVEGAIMVLDGARGVEARTRKLFSVCRMQQMPVLTFVNKMDRDAMAPLDILDDIGRQLGAEAQPLNWPVGDGTGFRGAFSLADACFRHPAREDSAGRQDAGTIRGLESPELARLLPEQQLGRLKEDVSLLREIFPAHDPGGFLSGRVTPVLFGSARLDFGIREILGFVRDHFPGPGPRTTLTGTIGPDTPGVSGFVFRIQANMDPGHRDRIAFVRLVSGRFRRGTRLRLSRTGRTLSIPAPVFFLSRQRSVIEEALAGDIIGISSHGVLRVGDTLSEAGTVDFTGNPCWAPEILRRVRCHDPARLRQLRRALQDLGEEGLLQVFRPEAGGDRIVGGVGAMQLDVLLSRLGSEYGVTASLEPVPFETARWIGGPDPDIQAFCDRRPQDVAYDIDDAPVFLARNAWELARTGEEFPALEFLDHRERITRN